MHDLHEAICGDTACYDSGLCWGLPSLNRSKMQNGDIYFNALY